MSNFLVLCARRKAGDNLNALNEATPRVAPEMSINHIRIAPRLKQNSEILTMNNYNTTMAQLLLVQCLLLDQRLPQKSSERARLVESNDAIVSLHLVELPKHSSLVPGVGYIEYQTKS